MELVYDMLLPAFTGIMVSFLVAKLVAMALRCEQLSVDRTFDGAESRASIEENYDFDNRLSVKSSARATKRYRKTTADEQTALSELHGEVTEPTLTEIPGVSVSEVEKSSTNSSDEFPSQLTELPEKVTDLDYSTGAQLDKISFTQTPRQAAAEELGCPDSDATVEEVLDSRLDLATKQTLQFRPCEISSLTQGILDTEVVVFNDQVINDSDRFVVKHEQVDISNDQVINDSDSVVEHEHVSVLNDQVINAQEEKVGEHVLVASNSELHSCGISEMKGPSVGTVISNQDEKLETVEVVEGSANQSITNQDSQTGNLLSGQDAGKEDKNQSIDDATDKESLSDDNVVADLPEQEMVLNLAETAVEENSEKLQVFGTDEQADRATVLLGMAQEETGGGGVREEGNGIDLEISSDDAEEWEGIERSELERDFARALNFVQCGDTEGRLSEISNELIMQLYGLQKVAMEGPCHESAPMALKLSARAKWNVWNDLGSMSPDEAMERYISVLSDKVPGWMNGQVAVKEGIANTYKPTALNIPKENAELDTSVSKPEEESPLGKDEPVGAASSANPDQ